MPQGWEPQDREGMVRSVELGVDVGVAWLFWRPVSKLESHQSTAGQLACQGEEGD